MRSLQHRRTRLARAWPALVLLTLLFPPLLRADAGIIPLHELAGGASSIFVGEVVSIEPMKSPVGSWILDVTVEQTIAGAELQRFSLRASSTDPSLPAVQQPGTKLIVFVPAVQRTITEGEVIPLSPNHPPEPGIELIREVAEGRIGLLLPAVQKYQNVPPQLLGSLLETLRPAVGAKEAPLLLRMGCTSTADFRMEVQLFALEELGMHQVAAARPCLEATSLSTENLSRRLAAVEALGNLRDPASVKPLITLLPRLSPSVIAALRGDEEDPRGGIGPENDPESEGGAEDPDERDRTGAPDPAEDDDRGLPRDPDGEREPDFAPRTDDSFAGEDGGLADAAVLALGKIGNPEAIPELFRVAREGDDLALHSSVVVALGMIGHEGWPAKVNGPLTSISRSNPNELVRALAMQTLARLAGGR